MVARLLVLVAGVMVLAACGFVGDDGENGQARLVNQAGVIAADDEASAAEATAAQAESTTSSTIGVLRVAVGDSSSTEESASTEAGANPDTSPSTDSDANSDSETNSDQVNEPTDVDGSDQTANSTTSTVASTSSAPTSTEAPTTTEATTTTPPTTASTTSTTEPPKPTGGLTYKGILAAGDNEITAFDNGRKKVKGLFVDAGVQAGNLIELSRQPSEQVNGVRATTVSGIEQAMMDLNVGDGDACILFLTSHGNQQVWFVRGDSGLTPQKLDQLLDASCGSRPTIALISACYSGIFISPLAQPNRVVLTAASPTNTSFGCSPEATYTYWDGCLIDHFNQASTWEDLYSRVTSCIEAKESRAGVTPSRPQAHFGADVANLPILNR